MVVISSPEATKPLVLVGFMASGKSTIGPVLAARLDIGFVDTDDELEIAFGMSIADIFREHGEASFRTAERRAIASLLDERRRVIAAGGGAFVDPQARLVLARSAITVWLDPPFDTIRQRLGMSLERPLAAGKSDAQLHQLWSERRAIYSAADIHLQLVDDEPTIVVDQIIERLERS